MSTAIDVYQPLTNAQLEIIRKAVAPKATSDEIAFFAQFCDYYQLSPFMEQVYFVDYGRGHKPYLGVNGRLALASRSGRLAGIDGPYFRKPRTDDERAARDDGDWLDYWEHEGNPYVARVLVWRTDWKIPARGTALWRIWNKSNSQAWKQYPDVMLGNKALVRALKQAFPEHNVTRELEPDEEIAASETMTAATIDAGYVIHRPDNSDQGNREALDAPSYTATATVDKDSNRYVAQTTEIKALFQKLGCMTDSDEDRAARMSIVTDAFGEPVKGSEMTIDDRDKLIRYLHSITN